MPLPFAPGLEAARIVEAVGAGFTNPKVADYIIFSSRLNCEHCHYWSRGRSVLCNAVTRHRVTSSRKAQRE